MDKDSLYRDWFLCLVLGTCDFSFMTKEVMFSLCQCSFGWLGFHQDYKESTETWMENGSRPRI